MNYLYFLLFFLAAAISSATANIAEYDDHWKKRAADARKSALKAYHEDPDEVTDHLNSKVHLSFASNNSTRRLLKGKRYKGPCLATNPIDRCWRCDPNWEKNRKKLANCVLGFGRKTRGGAKGDYYVVTDPSDDNVVDPKPGTLRYGVVQKEPLWIIFARNMQIVLKQELLVGSYKTIDARGANVHIAHGAQITVQYAKHVIIHGLHIHDIKPFGGGLMRDKYNHVGVRGTSDGDAISIFGSNNVWVDHVSAWNCFDGLVDVVGGSTAITISNNHFTKHDHVMLFGASDTYSGDSIMQITVAFNHFGKGLIQRMPRCRMGFFHVVNNDYTHWEMYAIGGSMNSTIVSEGNKYVAPDDPRFKEATHRADPSDPNWHKWRWTSSKDKMVNGAFFTESGVKNQDRTFSKKDKITSKSGNWVTRLTRFSGSLPCKVGKPC